MPLSLHLDQYARASWGLRWDAPGCPRRRVLLGLGWGLRCSVPERRMTASLLRLQPSKLGLFGPWVDGRWRPRRSPISSSRFKEGCGKLLQGLGREEEVRALCISLNAKRNRGTASGIRLGLRVSGLPVSHETIYVHVWNDNDGFVADCLLQRITVVIRFGRRTARPPPGRITSL